MTDPDSMVSGGIENVSMRRADRLFQIIQILRRSTRPVTATKMAEELELSVRTIYRDVADLIAQRVPIHGEAGLGYLLDGEFDMPPLMLTPNEIEAAVLGAQWVVKQGDPELSGAARDLIAKIGATIPERLRHFIVEPSVGTPPGPAHPPDGLDIARVRVWIRNGHKIRIRYRDHNETESERTIWPTHRLYRSGTLRGRMVRASTKLPALQDRSHYGVGFSGRTVRLPSGRTAYPMEAIGAGRLRLQTSVILLTEPRRRHGPSQLPCS